MSNLKNIPLNTDNQAIKSVQLVGDYSFSKFAKFPKK